MGTIEISDQNFDDKVLKSSSPVLVDFWADWCGPCKMIAPVLEELANDFNGRVTIAKVNIDDSPMTPGKYGVRSIPTLMLFKDGKLVDSQLGAQPKGKLSAWIESKIA
jgi:thioredoxin 1